MVETLGSQLRRARVERQLSLADAAHVTKVRASRLADLENDVYTNFPNIAYARGFLVIYGRFLGVDTTPYLGAFEDANTFGLDDYQYLSEQPVAQYRAVRREPPKPFRLRRNAPRHRVPVVVPALVAAFLAVGLGGWWLSVRFQQLGSLSQLAARQDARFDQPAAAPPTSPDAAEASAPVSSWSLADAPPPAASPAEASAAPPGLVLASNDNVAAAAAASRESLTPAPPKAVPATLPSKEVIVRPLRKTYVTVVVNDPGARPVYEDWLGPGARPLSFRGDKFFVHVLDRNCVEISKNGVVQTQAGTDIYIE